MTLFEAQIMNHEALQYEDTRARRLKHYKPTRRPRRSWAPLRTRLAHVFQTAATWLEIKPSSSADPIKG